MNKTKIMAVALWCCMAAAFTACIDDDSSYGGKAISELSISNATSDGMIVKNINLGEACEIVPEVNYSGNSSDLQYEWSLGTYESSVKGTLEVISNDPTFRYSFQKGGVYYVHLKLTDGTVGVAQDYCVNVNRSFERGYVLVSNDASGHGNLSFIKTLTDEDIEAGTEQIIIEHSLEAMNPEVGNEKLIGAGIVKLTWPTTKTRLLAVTENVGYFIDPNTFTAISQIKYSDVRGSSFKATHYFGDSTYPGVYDASMKKFIHFEADNMFGFEYGYYKGQTFDELYEFQYSSWGSIYSNKLFVTRSPFSLKTFDSNRAIFASTEGTTYNDVPVYQDEDFVTTFQGNKAVSYVYPFYMITRSTVDGSLYLYNHKVVAAGTYPNYTGTFETSAKTAIAADENTAVPPISSNIAVSATYARYYYFDGNKVYALVINSGVCSLPQKDEFIMSFPDNEEVTYVGVNTSEELYVATCDKSTGRGNFYVYNVSECRADNQNGATAKLQYKNCADRITYVLYKDRV